MPQSSVQQQEFSDSEDLMNFDLRLKIDLTELGPAELWTSVGSKGNRFGEDFVVFLVKRSGGLAIILVDHRDL